MVLYKRVVKKIIQPEISISFQQVSLTNYTDVIPYKGTRVASFYKKLLMLDEYLGLYVYYSGKVIAHGWMVYNNQVKTRKVRNYIKLSMHSGFIFHCAVHPDYRGKKIYQALLSELYVRAEAIGINSIYIDTGSDNVSARKAIEKSGCHFVTIMKLLYLRSHVICRLR